MFYFYSLINLPFLAVVFCLLKKSSIEAEIQISILPNLLTGFFSKTLDEIYTIYMYTSSLKFEFINLLYEPLSIL